MTKRLFDIVCASLGLLVLLPLGLVLGVLVRLADGGPVFYQQTRIGRGGKPFRIRKFRSMVVDAEKLGVPLTKEEDPRITWIGRWLRKTKLDELPQLWNVLVGDMSFVGPRPEVPRYVECYTPEQRQILEQKPGITDLATLYFRNEEALLRGTGDVEGFYLRYCLPRKIELNREYAQHASLLRDIWIILQTLCPYWFGVLVVYGLALLGSFWLAYQLRSDFAWSEQDCAQFKLCLPWVVIPQLLLLMCRAQLRGLLSYFSIPELRRTAVSLCGAFVLQIGLCHLSQGHTAPTLSILLMDLLLSFFAVCGIRMGLRLLREFFSASKPGRQPSPWRIAIIGTNEVATNLALELIRQNHGAKRVIAFFDDNPRTWHKRPHDVPVVGMPECLLNPEWSEKLDEVIVALPQGQADRVQELSAMLQRLPVKATFASSWPVLQPLAG